MTTPQGVDVGEVDKKKIGEAAAESTTAINPLTASLSYKDLRASAAKLSRQAVRNPTRTLKHAFRLWGEDLAILMGRSKRQPEKNDRRFKDQAWMQNPIFYRSMQHWLALSEHFENWVADLELEEDERIRAQYVSRVLMDAVAPSNALATNPTALKKLIDTGGLSLLRGSQNFLNDLRRNGGLPAQVDKSAYTVGEDLASTPGEVVWRSHLLELIQFQPSTDQVHETPYFGIPPQINKYYLFDLSAEKSVARYLVSQGIQCFWVSWRNPTKKDRDFGMTEYIEHVVQAMDVARSISGSDKLNVGGACSGGITLATLASYLSFHKDDRINSLTFKVCVLDSRENDTELGQMTSDKRLEAARESSQRDGVLKGGDLARTFAWMRPNDLIWNYVVNNYLLGEDPPAFDILYWNSDTTNLTAALHSDFLDVTLFRPFAHPGKVTLAEHPVDLSKVQQDAFVVAGQTDHITPWHACYRTTQLLGSKKIEFVLSSSGHIQALLNPPTNPKANYYRGSKLPNSHEAWFSGAERVSESWWLLWSEWLKERSGPIKAKPNKLGSNTHPPMYPAPGKYVLADA